MLCNFYTSTSTPSDRVRRNEPSMVFPKTALLFSHLTSSRRGVFVIQLEVPCTIWIVLQRDRQLETDRIGRSSVILHTTLLSSHLNSTQLNSLHSTWLALRRCTVCSVPCTRYRLQCLGIRPHISPPHFACRYLAQVVRVAWPLAHAAEYGALPVHEGEGRVELGSGSRVHDQHVVEEGDGVQSVRDAQHRHSLELVAHCVLRCGVSAYVRVDTSVRSDEFTRSTWEITEKLLIDWYLISLNYAVLTFCDVSI